MEFDPPEVADIWRDQTEKNKTESDKILTNPILKISWELMEKFIDITYDVFLVLFNPSR